MMKKSFINKTVKAIALACALVAVLSCKNGMEPEQNAQEAKKATVSLKVHNLEEYKNAQNSVNAARTVNPVIELDELTDFVFSGAKTGDTPQKLASFDTLADMPEKIEVPYEATTEEWTFVLTANKGASLITGSTRKTLQSGDNELVLTVSLDAFATGYGSFAITVDFSTATNCDKITKAEAYIENKDGSSVSGFDKVNFGYDSSYDYYISDYSFTYVAENLPKGTYRAVVKLYDGDVILGYWQDLINISDSLTSSATATIDKLNKAYDVDYFIYRSDEAADASLVFEPVYVLSATATELPEPARDDYVFMGWYTDYDLTKPVVLPLTQDTNLYAYWESLIPPTDGSYYPATAETVELVIASITSAPASAPAVIKVLGKIDNETISTICQAITDNYYNSNNAIIYYSIDLSKTFGLTSIPDSAFKNCSNLAGFVIPDSVTEIGNAAFKYTYLKAIKIPDSVTKIGDNAFCGNYIEEIEIPESVVTIGDDAFKNMSELESITVSDKNPNYKSIDGVLYSRDGKVLISYPAGKNDISKFDIPSGVETIKSYAFSDAQYLTEITIPDSVTYILNAFRGFENLETVNIGSGINNIDRFDFFGCSKIENITISQDNTYYYVDSNDGALYSADGKVLVLYPNGNTRIAFNVPASVELIDYPILADAENLTQVVFPNDGAAWYCGSKTYSQIDLILKGTKMDISDYSENCSTLKNNNGQSCIKINNFQNVLSEFFGTNTPEVSVYKTESTVVDVGDTNPEYTSVTTGTSYTFYKIETEVGSTYNVNFVDSETCSNYTLPDSWHPDNCYIIVFGNDGTRIVDQKDAQTLLSFVAKTSVTYIGLKGCGSNCKCAFRVWAQIVKTGVTVEVKSSEVAVTANTDNEGKIIFEADSSYSSYNWYVDGELDQNQTGNTFDFYFDSYDSGIRLITLEVEKDGLYYSYSAQVIVKESHGAQC